MGGGGWGVGGSQYVGVCPRENLPVFKIQRLECLSLLSTSKTMKKKHCSNFILRIYKFFFLGRRGGGAFVGSSFCSAGLDLMFTSSRGSCCGGRSVVIVVGSGWECEAGLLLLFSSMLFSKVMLACLD